MKPLRQPIRHFLLFCICISSSSAQLREAAGGFSIDEVARRAKLIFVGTVAAIEQPEDQPVVKITFQVEDGIRGANAGSPLMIREWSGTWNGAPRYRVGERVLLFLYDSTADGLTSPVAGNAGIFRFSKADAIKLNPDQQKAISRSERLRSALAMSDTSDVRRSVPATELVRAIRLSSQ